mmetsp:Transcript_4083/g.11005  ORF Transcript_4083/g.11005 Transcript_4083/m.11005 type:complete len:202 (+) Transcript_4083:974-1579(+)
MALTDALRLRSVRRDLMVSRAVLYAANRVSLPTRVRRCASTSSASMTASSSTTRPWRAPWLNCCDDLASDSRYNGTSTTSRKGDIPSAPRVVATAPSHLRAAMRCCRIPKRALSAKRAMRLTRPRRVKAKRLYCAAMGTSSAPSSSSSSSPSASSSPSLSPSASAAAPAGIPPALAAAAAPAAAASPSPAPSLSSSLLPSP